jgi:hypothetical protein
VREAEHIAMRAIRRMSQLRREIQAEVA